MNYLVAHRGKLIIPQFLFSLFQNMHATIRKSTEMEEKPLQQNSIKGQGSLWPMKCMLIKKTILSVNKSVTKRNLMEWKNSQEDNKEILRILS